MRHRFAVPVIAAVASLALAAFHQQPAAPEPKPAASPLAAAVNASSRTDSNRLRDRYRNPAETLAFFGVEPDDTVVELWPGGGWYTEVLAPYVTGSGALIVVPPAGQYDERIRAKLGASPAYSTVRVATFTAGEPLAIAPGTADVVLTFRNVHNWLMADAPIADEVFAVAFRALKPGGTLGVVEHRLPEDADAAREQESGYVKTSTVRALAAKAGFRFVGSSEINANAKDTKDHPRGVWTLPPGLALGEQDRDKYLAIGESDRMTLKFVKPLGDSEG